MLLTYLDESYTKERYLIAAVAVPDGEATSLTMALDKVVFDATCEYGRIPLDAELHARDLVAATGPWQRLADDVGARIDVYGKALQAIADHDVAIIIRSVDIPRLDQRYPFGHDHPHSVVLTHILERVNEYATQVGLYAIVIADEVDAQDSYRRELWHYQHHQTWGYKAQQIDRVIDTIHFAPSSSSRLLQGADLIASLARRIETHVEKDERAKRANDALWAQIQPKIHHRWCWWP